MIFDPFTDLAAKLRFIAQIHEGRSRHECISQAADLLDEAREWYVLLMDIDWPCETCDGGGWLVEAGGQDMIPCPDCPDGQMPVKKRIEKLIAERNAGRAVVALLKLMGDA